MLLRRVIKHFKNQEWTAIAIDFVIVVIGVFVGIQVANWNADVIEQSETHDYMQRLENDLRLSTVQHRIHGNQRGLCRLGA